MAAKIGPTFNDECKAAGISDWRWAIDEATAVVSFDAAVPQAQRDLLAQVIAAHDPTKPSDAQVAQAVQTWLDGTVQAAPYNYQDIATAVSYAGSTVDLWNRQGAYCRSWRDAVWQKVFDIQSQVKAGTMQQPASIGAFIALLPQPSIPTS